MVADYAAGRDQVDQTVFARAQGEIIVLKAVAVFLVEAAGFQEPLATEHAASGGDGGKLGVRPAFSRFG